MRNDTPITVVGNLTDTPELRFTPSGTAVCRFTVAVNHRRFDKTTSAWVETEPAFHRVSAWNQQAENIASSFDKGERVIVVGRLEYTTWTDAKTNEKRGAFQITADEVGGSAAFATVKMTRANRRSEVPDTQWDAATADRPAGDPWANGNTGGKPF